MCRSGGRRCKGSANSSRATQTARQQRSRARRALRQARAAGDDSAAQQAQQRLDDANAILKRHKENRVSSHDSHDADQQPRDDAARQHGDVTNIVHGEIRGFQADVINGGLTFDASTGRFTIGNDRGDGGDVTAPHGVHINNFTQSAGRVGSQNDINRDDVTLTVGSTRNDSAHAQDRARHQEERARYRQERAQYRAERAARAGTSQPPSGGFNVHTGPDGTGPVNITDDNGNTLLQAGTVHGGIWVNGKRVQ
ncbi:hypothetical protein GCM10022267_04430 [Lentzea roselyniae]|uniref:Uncharacterized protein n=1 Tax=Lentzea roselyniae TaxID=531940 RepID=A0ABP6ZX94_9PSEU